MLNGIYRAASAMGVAEHRQDVVADNLAHMNVPGFRKSSLIVQTFENALANANDEEKNGTIGQLEGIAIDHTPGPIVSTGRPLDVALDGDGFFVVEGPDGPLYTRNGSFHISQDGELVSSSGLPVLGDGGPISIPSDASPAVIDISNDGSISIAGSPSGKLRVAHFEDNQELRAAGTTLFEAPVGVEPDDAEVGVFQGYRESSNVSSVHEMIEMITNMRQHEAAERVLKELDGALQLVTNPQGG